MSLWSEGYHPGHLRSGIVTEGNIKLASLSHPTIDCWLTKKNSGSIKSLAAIVTIRGVIVIAFYFPKAILIVTSTHPICFAIWNCICVKYWPTMKENIGIIFWSQTFCCMEEQYLVQIKFQIARAIWRAVAIFVQTYYSEAVVKNLQQVIIIFPFICVCVCGRGKGEKTNQFCAVLQTPNCLTTWNVIWVKLYEAKYCGQLLFKTFWYTEGQCLDQIKFQIVKEIGCL